MGYSRGTAPAGQIFASMGGGAGSRRALKSVQPGLRGFHQGCPRLGRVVNARSFAETTVVINDDAGCAAVGGQRCAVCINGWKAIGDVQAQDAARGSAAAGSDAVVRDPHENVVLLQRSVVILRHWR